MKQRNVRVKIACVQRLQHGKKLTCSKHFSKETRSNIKHFHDTHEILCALHENLKCGDVCQYQQTRVEQQQQQQKKKQNKRKENQHRSIRARRVGTFECACFIYEANFNFSVPSLQ